MRSDLPSGTVTFLFTDIEGSTKLLHELGADRYAAELAEHRRILREAFGAHGGVEVDTQGDAFFIAFPAAPAALAAAAEARQALAAGPIRVRIGIHTGTPHLGEEGYVGADVHKGARIAAAGHGGQVLLSKETRELAQVDVADLGEHRLKDFEGPVSIFQLGSERFPPLKTISNTNLPRPASSFVGREKEMEHVAALVRDRARLLTLTGPGGSGKTRLAIEAASELVPEFKAGVFWVGLAPLRDPALVTDTIGQTLGATDGLVDHIAERDLLLVLDNLEQVIEAAPELASLVEACPNLKLIATSRELLRVRGEVEYPVLPLAEPEAVSLFCERAGAEPDETALELCRALDNLPLALELAAARASVLTPGQILERLSGRLDLLKGGRDADPRQQTLRATIEWSYELLSAEEQQLYARLAIFVGGCTLEAAEEVANADLDTLQSLVDKSLLRHTDDRFWMLETIRGYALERLEASGEADELSARHARFFVDFAARAEPEIEGGNQELWLERLDTELNNLRAAFVWTGGRPGNLRLQLVGSLPRFWAIHGPLGEGRGWIEEVLADDGGPPSLRIRALRGAAFLSQRQGDTAAARAWSEQGLALARTHGEAGDVAFFLRRLGDICTGNGDYVQAARWYDESIALLRSSGDELGLAASLTNRAELSIAQGEYDGATELFEESLALFRGAGFAEGTANVLQNLGFAALYRERFAEAAPLLMEGTRLAADLDDKRGIADGLEGIGAVVAAEGNLVSAARRLAAAQAIRESIGGVIDPIERTIHERTVEVVRAGLGDEFAPAWAEGASLSPDEALELALRLD